MTWQVFLGLTVVAALISVMGNLVARYLKDFLGVRSFERWKAQQSLVALYDRYRKPIALAAQELSGRCYSLGVQQSHGPREKVGLEMLQSEPQRDELTGAVDDHFLRYRFVSDVYRLCCFLGWIELYRRDLGLLDAGAEDQNRALDSCLQSIRSDLADGHINSNKNWHEWTDALIFREEQRAIGHRMIAGPATSLVDFGTFYEQLERDLEGNESARWFVLAARFFTNLQSKKDFRLVRMQRLVVHLADLRQLLHPGSVLPEHLKSTKQLTDQLIAKGYLGRTLPV
jgi:hypothetical protein